MKTKLLFATILILSIAVKSYGQNLVINGNFENNTAPYDTINCTSAAFNSLMSDVYSFGKETNPDIIASDAFCNYPKDSKWYVSLTGGGTDAITMKLSSPVVAGNVYVLSYWVEGCNFGLYKPEFGITSNDSTTGTVVYVGPTSENGVWKNYVDTFTATVSGTYLSLNAANGDIGSWNQYDDIILQNASSTTASIKMSASAICSNQPVTIAFNGNVDSSDTYTWNFNGGNVVSGASAGPYQVEWSAKGTYYVSVTVSASNGDTATAIDTVTVNPTPTAAFALDTTIAAGETDLINYMGSGSGSSSYNWTFNNALIEANNGDTSYQMTWTTPGVYTIALAVTQDGCTSQPITRKVYVVNPLTVATPICTDSLCMVSYLGFINDSINYNWSFSGANIIAGKGAGPYTLQYPTPGSYPVFLNITIDSINYTFSDTIEVTSGGYCAAGTPDSTHLNNNNNGTSPTSGDSTLTAGIDMTGKKLVIDNIYPNPTMGNLNIDFQTSVPGSVHFEVYDVLGRLIISNYRNAGESVNTTVLNTSELPAGSYFVRIIEDSANFSDTQKFIKLL